MGRVLRRLLPAAVVVGLAVLSAAGALAAAPVPERLVLEGEFRIDRATPDDCFVSVPPLLAGTIRLTVDYRAGEVTGRLEGSGSGDDRVPGGCRSSGSPAVYRADLQFSGDIDGTADSATGRFRASATLQVTGEGFYSVPGSQLSCALSSDPGLQSECPLSSVASPQTAEVTGTLTSEEPFQGEIDWYTNFCLAVSSGGVSYTREGCPTRGMWTARALEIVLPANRDPVITDVRVEPESPREGQPVVVTAVAHDPDGDRLTFRWTVDGAGQGTAGASLPLANPAAGDYWVELTVVDDRGGKAETSLGFTVTAVTPPASETAETTTTSLSVGDDPLAAADQEEPAAGEEAAAPDDQGAMWESGSSGLPEGAGLVVLIFAVLAGVFSASLLVGYLVRLRMGWGRQEAAEDALLAEGLTPPSDEPLPLSWFEVLREGQYQQEGGRPEPGWKPPGMREKPHVSGVRKTPTEYHQSQPGLMPGRYRWVELSEPVYLEKPLPGGGVELISTEYYGGLVGEPDPGFPGHSPAYGQHGERIGWVRTADLPK